MTVTKIFQLCVFFTIILVKHTFSQGGVNVDYLPIEQLSDSMISKDVKPDFRSLNGNHSSLTVWQKELKKDTFYLKLFGEDVLFVEIRKRYVDAYNYNEQFLESSNYSKHETIRIHNTVIEDIEHNKVKLRFYLEFYSDSKKKKNYIIRRLMKSVWINKSELDGFLIRI